MSLQSQGFDKIGVYEGSFDDWNKNLGRVLKGEGFPIVGYEQVEAGLKDTLVMNQTISDPIGLLIDIAFDHVAEEQPGKRGHHPCHGWQSSFGHARGHTTCITTTGE